MDVLQNAKVFPYARKKVQEILLNTPSFAALAEPERRELAHNMVKLATYMAGGDTGENLPAAVQLAQGPALQIARLRDPAGDTAGDRLKESGAIAAQQGATSFEELTQKVDFPKFVAGLIDGVFNAIVTSSIKQMQAYAELVKNVAKSVDEFMKDNVSENSARDYLAGRYPDYLEVNTDEDQPKLKPKEGHDEDNMPDFFKDLGLSQPVTSLDEDTVEQQLVPAARKRMAMDRQQLLATMVLMGINRLVVTDGTISASVLFQLDTKDDVSRHYNQATDYERNRQGNWSGSGQYQADWYSGNWNYQGSNTTNFKVATTQSEDSQAKVDLHAKLTGKVDVRFRSDVFPLDRMADILQMNEIRQKASPGAAGQPATAGASPAPATPGTAPAPAPAPAAPGQPAR